MVAATWAPRGRLQNPNASDCGKLFITRSSSSNAFRLQKCHFRRALMLPLHLSPPPPPPRRPLKLTITQAQTPTPRQKLCCSAAAAQHSRAQHNRGILLAMADRRIYIPSPDPCLACLYVLPVISPLLAFLAHSRQHTQETFAACSA